MGKKLAIKGHLTRGKEVIELLEMLGGKNTYRYTGDMESLYFSIYNDTIIYGSDISFSNDNYVFFTLEEFLEKYPYKVMDKVFLCDNITEGCVTGMKWDEDKGTVKYCVYTLAECWCDDGSNYIETFETKVLGHKDICHHNVTGEVQLGHPKQCKDVDDVRYVNSITDDIMINQITNKVSVIKLKPDVCDNKIELQFDDYEIEVRDGKTYAVRKKPFYPKTYVECCEVIANSKPYAMNEHYTDVNKLLQNFQTLIICRNAYWKIVGEEMGLDKPWEPDWNEETDKFTISNKCNKIYLNNTAWYAEVLSFPTAEMRDAFYENFKNEIEQCKELL